MGDKLKLEDFRSGMEVKVSHFIYDTYMLVDSITDIK